MIDYFLYSYRIMCVITYRFHSGFADNVSTHINLDNLLIQLRTQVTPKWYQFGEKVGISHDVLNRYAECCSPDECIVEMLDYWLRNSKTSLSWRDIAEVLEAINLPKLASAIMNVNTTGDHIG